MKENRSELSENAAELVTGGIHMIRDPKADLKENLHKAITKKMQEDLSKTTKIK